MTAQLLNVVVDPCRAEPAGDAGAEPALGDRGCGCGCAQNLADLGLHAVARAFRAPFQLALHRVIETPDDNLRHGQNDITLSFPQESLWHLRHHVGHDGNGGRVVGHLLRCDAIDGVSGRVMNQKVVGR